MRYALTSFTFAGSRSGLARSPARAESSAHARGARRWRRELGGGVRRRPGSTTALRGLMASLALRSARPWRAMGMRDRPAGCANRATPPVRRSVRQRAAAARRPTSIVCWWQSGDAGGAEGQRRAPAPACAGDDGPPRSSVRPTRHSPPHGDIDDADVAAAAAGCAARLSYGVIENTRH